MWLWVREPKESVNEIRQTQTALGPKAAVLLPMGQSLRRRGGKSARGGLELPEGRTSEEPRSARPLVFPGLTVSPLPISSAGAES